MKRKFSEEDIKLRYITPSLTNKGWSVDDITMETGVQFTDGKITLKGNSAERGQPKRADYILYLNKATPIAIVEAKDMNHSVTDGLQQAMQYAKIMDLPFAFSSNGEGFAEHDFLTGKERIFPLTDFPTKEELYQRYKNEINNGKGLSEKEQELINQPYCSGQGINSPRYYQRNAINRTLNAIAKGQNRILLVMATGTGKTYTAFQIIYRLLQSGIKRKVLYLADRNILVDQSIQQDFKPLEKVVHKINVATEDPQTITSYKVYFALYQQLIGDDEKEYYKELFDKDFFDLIVVDECHRGSARDDSRWRVILEYFSSATQIGMTATPKETKYLSNLSYFGEPVYKYSLNEGIEDGFLAPFKVINITTNIGDGWRPTKGQTDDKGNIIEDRIYNNTDYDYNIVIEDRIKEVAKAISDYLKSTDRMAKTIIFCANEEHAARMRMALINENKDLVKQNSDYVVRITSSDIVGKSKLDYFISVNSKYPVIATTSELLSTGVDCKMVKLIVLDQNINSMTKFKQIIGRGTRIREKEGKTHFVVMDFRNITRLFADPDWDGPIEIDDNYPPEPPKPCQICGKYPCVCPKETYLPPPPPTTTIKPVVKPDGCKVFITNKVVSIYDSKGKLLHTENIIDYTKSNILNSYSTLNNFINYWNGNAKNKIINDLLENNGIDIQQLKKDSNMQDVDVFDFICYIAYGKKPLTRRERAENVTRKDIFSKYGEQARQVLNALLEKYQDEGILQLEDRNILLNDPLRKFGSPSTIAGFFGGKEQYEQAIKELEDTLYNIA
ncbi:MAG: DEAD/DEAH box helicase family protein [Bacteroidota bacterium]|nr:DEAD/DEAH box helicase family protein [Bacteroidota bacterium]